MDSESKVAERIKLENTFRAGANWFFWIAGLSLVNSIVVALGKEWGFVVGLGTTQVIDAFGKAAGGGAVGTGVALFLDLIVLAFVVLFGFLCRRGQVWAFALGMVLYGLDGIIFLVAGDWFGVGFHALVLVFIFGGMNALRKLKSIPPESPPESVATPQEAISEGPIEPR